VVNSYISPNMRRAFMEKHKTTKDQIKRNSKSWLSIALRIRIVGPAIRVLLRIKKRRIQKKHTIVWMPSLKRAS
jgi:hypothetical protein